MSIGIVALELGVGIFISFLLLGMFIWAVRQGQFDDDKKQMGGLLFDSTDDLQDAVTKDDKVKAMRAKKKSKINDLP